MINLLPPEVKENTVYAKRNSRLRRWTIGLFASILAILTIVAAGQIYLQSSIRSYSTQVQQGQDELKAQNLEDAQSKVQDLTDSLKLVVQVLSREILFSKLITQIGSALPNGTILTDLSINKLQGGIDLRAATVDKQSATQVQLNLQDPNNKIFDRADIINIQCDSATASKGDPVKSQYPCTVQLRALFSQSNSFAFIPKSSSSGAKQ